MSKILSNDAYVKVVFNGENGYQKVNNYILGIVTRMVSGLEARPYTEEQMIERLNIVYKGSGSIDLKTKVIQAIYKSLPNTEIKTTIDKQVDLPNEPKFYPDTIFDPIYKSGYDFELRAKINEILSTVDEKSRDLYYDRVINAQKHLLEFNYIKSLNQSENYDIRTQKFEDDKKYHIELNRAKKINEQAALDRLGAMRDAVDKWQIIKTDNDNVNAYLDDFKQLCLDHLDAEINIYQDYQKEYNYEMTRYNMLTESKYFGDLESRVHWESFMDFRHLTRIENDLPQDAVIRLHTELPVLDIEQLPSDTPKTTSTDVGQTNDNANLSDTDLSDSSDPV